MNPSDFKPIAEWNSLGFKVKLGHKALWVDNKPVFYRSQVIEAEKFVRSSCRTPFHEPDDHDIAWGDKH